MTQTKDHDRAKAKPSLIAREETGEYLLILRETRFNSQNYPLVKETPQPERFGTVAAARAFAKAEFGAVAGQFATQAGRAD